MKANAENLKRRAPGRALFLAVTARVNWCRPRVGRARIAGGATPNVARMPGKRFDELRKCRKGNKTKKSFKRKKLRSSAPAGLDTTHSSAPAERSGDGALAFGQPLARL